MTERLWICEECEHRTEAIPDAECPECGAESWDERKVCPECETLMEYNGASGRDSKGRDVGVSWYECPGCGTYVDPFGNVSTPEDQQEALEEAKAAMREARDQ